MNYVSLSSNLKWPLMSLRMQERLVILNWGWVDGRRRARDNDGGDEGGERWEGKVFKSMVAGECA
jgi:hypothetical protein